MGLRPDLDSYVPYEGKNCHLLSLQAEKLTVTSRFSIGLFKRGTLLPPCMGPFGDYFEFKGSHFVLQLCKLDYAVCES